MTTSNKNIFTRSSHKEVDKFLAQIKKNPLPVQHDSKGRLVFGMDATASREPLWDRACHIQSQMFEATSSIGKLLVQLVYYRGFREFQVTRWHSSGTELLDEMNSIRCIAGQTQIARLLRHALNCARVQKFKIDALVFVGDSMEENPDILAELAGELSLVGTPVFIFQDSNDAIAAKTFSHIADLTKGAHCTFNSSSPNQLRDLLCAVAIYATGGYKALKEYERLQGGQFLRLTSNIKGGD